MLFPRSFLFIYSLGLFLSFSVATALVLLPGIVLAKSPAAPKADAAKEASLTRSNKMEFDERLVKGQAAKSGAVYLFKRVPRQLPNLVAIRRSYRERIVRPVLGERKLSKQITPSTAGKTQTKGQKKRR